MDNKGEYQKVIKIPKRVMDSLDKIYKGHFIELFREVETILGREPKVYDYHKLYRWCLEQLFDCLCGSFFLNPYGEDFAKIQREQRGGKVYFNQDGGHYYEIDGNKQPLSDKEFLHFKKIKKELDATFDLFAEKIESPNDKLNEILQILDKHINDPNIYDLLPELDGLNKLTEGNVPILRKWRGGKFKCASLQLFIKAYIKISDNLTPALIRDYIISEKTGKPYSKNTIDKFLNLYGPGRK